MNALRVLSVALCLGLAACSPAAPTLVPTLPASGSLPRFEIDPEGVIGALKSGGSTSQHVLAIDYYAGYDPAKPPPECYQPCTKTWNAKFESNTAVLIGPGWCAADQATLADNLKHYKFTITVDGQPVSPRLIQSDSGNSPAVLSPGATETPMDCTFYGAVAYDWPVGLHRAVVSWTWDQDVNDGWNTYHRGTYANDYAVTVTP